LIARTRIVAAVAGSGAALAVVGAVLVGITYGNVGNTTNDAVGSQVGMNDKPNTGPEPSFEPPTDGEIAVMNTLDSYVDECMADAGFPQYFEQNVYAEDYVPVEDWDADLSAEQSAAAFLALWGDTGSGADYHWDEAGCHGYGVHMIGADNAN
jgi:hypothetical protein